MNAKSACWFFRMAERSNCRADFAFVEGCETLVKPSSNSTMSPVGVGNTLVGRSSKLT